MIIKEFKKDFYNSAIEAIKDNFKDVVVIPEDGENLWDAPRYLINGILYKFVEFDHFNGFPYSLKLRKCGK